MVLDCCMAFESWIEEMAREELNKLETLHPNRFDYLKTELKLLISQPNLEPLFVSQESSSLSLSQSEEPSTQVSSNQKRKFDRVVEDRIKWKKKRKDKVEAAIERANVCLRRIQEVKQSLILPVRA